MEETAANPLIIAVLCLLRCVVPLGILLGISYVLRRLGLIPQPPSAPSNFTSQAVEHGGLNHGAQ
jgi:hypothetical protein